MAFDMRPFNNSFFEGNPGDLFKDFGRQFLSNSQIVQALNQT